MGYVELMQHLSPQIFCVRENKDAVHKCYIANRKACSEDMVVESTEFLFVAREILLGCFI